jgi:2-oxoglutarate ferredoxin oxidoreductase subunit gamma
MTQNIQIAGFGGQGVMSMGQILCYGGMLEGREVSYLPSYGPEMRGGAAYCMVIVSDEPVGAPVFAQADCLMAMNLPALDKFENTVVPGGRLLINSSLIERKATRTDIDVYYIPANDIAAELGNSRVAGMVMLGAYLKLSGVVGHDGVLNALKKVLGEKKANMIPVNKEALEHGAAEIKD